MASERGTYPLEACMDAIIDYRGKTPTKTSSGIPLITAKIVKGGRILPVQEFIAANDYDSWMRRGFPQKGDVLITTEAPLGEVAQLDGRKVALAQRLIALRGKKGFLDNTFLKYLLQSNDVQHQLLGRSSGSTVTGIKQSELRKIFLTFPEYDEQRAIAHILGSLDDKIELNRKMSETLEAMAQAIFKSWFVDFDPAIDNALAAGNPIPDTLQDRAAVREALGDERKPLPEDIWKLFPSEFELTEEMGWVPKGWNAGCLGDIAIQQRRSVQPGAIAPETPYIGLEHMPRRCIALSEWGRAESLGSNKYEFRQGEILFGKLRPYFHKVGIAAINGVCSTDIVVVSPKKGKWVGLLLGHISSSEFVEHTNAGSTGTRMPRTNWKEMSRYNIALPSDSIASRFSEVSNSFVEKISANIHQSNSLEQLRDTLLPKLLSGEIRIPDAEKLAESAA